METQNKPSNPKAFPNDYSLEDGMNLRDYAQIKFMASIISNADTMREITKSWNNVPKDTRKDFEIVIADIAGNYADAMLKQREL